MTQFTYSLKTFEVKFSNIHDLTFPFKQVFNFTGMQQLGYKHTSQVNNHV